MWLMGAARSAWCCPVLSLQLLMGILGTLEVVASGCLTQGPRWQFPGVLSSLLSFP